MNDCHATSSRHPGAGVGALLLAFATSLVLLSVPVAAQQTFKTPEAAAAALIKALDDDDDKALEQLFGEAFMQEVANPDAAQERENRRRVAEAAGVRMQLREDDQNTRVMVLGDQAWPSPIPIVKDAAGWRFDGEAGADELFARRIGANELATIANLRAYVDAQMQYASADRDGDGVLEYAQRVRSSTGRKDGLYWPVEAGSSEELSPFGPFMVEKAAYLEGQEVGDPFMGYYYRVLTGQGEHAPGGKYGYVINDNMIAGFAMIAWPAEYNSSGIMTFMVSHNGAVFDKDHGDDTETAVEAIDGFNLDDSWSLVED